VVDQKQWPDSQRRGLSNVQLSEFVVQGLFNRYTHKIPLPTSTGDEPFPSVVILYGPNGIGKTTVLRMLDGLMSLNFDTFREIPFESCYLEFNTGQRLQVRRTKAGLAVTFEDHQVLLNPAPGTKGALNQNDRDKVEAFRTSFFNSVENISFNFIDSDRARAAKTSSLDSLPPDVVLTDRLNETTARRLRNELAYQRQWHGSPTLAESVRQFIRDAQLDSRAFFAGDEPDLFGKIIDDLSQPREAPKTAEEIERTLEQVHQQEKSHVRLGLRHDKWDYERLTSILTKPGSSHDVHTLTVLSTYADFLSSRAQARQLVAERLLTFEDVMDEFLVDKRVRVDSKLGLRIVADGNDLDELRLSSGEYQLLYLMVAALTTRRRGTVILIDEPELSMHIAWQRKLVRNLTRCASRATPQLVLATHSPEVATEFTEHMVQLAPSIN